MGCLFCEIAQGTVPAEVSYKDEQVVVFNDINPQAPQHKLVIPRKHIATLNDLSGDDTALMGHMVQVAKKVAADNDLAEEGYRLVINCNRGAGQTIFHIHIHVLGGRQLTWPPG